MENIRELRKARGLTQTELATQLGVSQACVAMWEGGTAVPSTDKLPILANVLGCSIDDMFKPEKQCLRKE